MYVFWRKFKRIKIWTPLYCFGVSHTALYVGQEIVFAVNECASFVVLVGRGSCGHGLDYEKGDGCRRSLQARGRQVAKGNARDDETGRIGTYQASFIVPNLNRETKRVAVSSIVLSSQQIDVHDAIYNAAKEKEQNKAEAVDPLVQNGRKFIPSVTRVFSQTRPMYVYLQAYEHNVETEQQLLAFVSFYRGTAKVFETQPLEVSSGLNNSLRAIPLNFTIPLNGLSPGVYTCQVSVLDATLQKSTFWRANVDIVP